MLGGCLPVGHMLQERWRGFDKYVRKRNKKESFGLFVLGGTAEILVLPV